MGKPQEAVGDIFFDSGKCVREARVSHDLGSLHGEGTIVMERWFLCSPNGRQLLIPEDGVVLGRAKGAVSLTGAGVSRQHVRLTPVPGGVRVADLGSTNGIRIDGTPLRETVMRAGQVLRVGDTNYFLVRVCEGKRLFRPDS
jgi:hypothetical protein